MFANWRTIFCLYRTECLEKWLLLKNFFKGKNFLYVINGVVMYFYSLHYCYALCISTQVYCFKLWGFLF